MIEITRIVTVKAVLPAYQPYRAKYIILRDASRREVLDVARKHPGVFIFPFATGEPQDCPDYRWLKRTGDSSRDYIAMPLYIGNLRPIEQAISETIRVAIGPNAIEEIL